MATENEPKQKRTDAQAQYMAEQFAKNLGTHGFVARPYDRANYLLEMHRGTGQQEKVLLQSRTDDWAFSIPGFKRRYVWRGNGLKALNAVLEDLATRANG